MRQAALPARGVYVYETSGFEEVNLPGSRRSYPDTTTITVLDAGCGVEYRWRANEDHTDSSIVCADGDSLTLSRFTNRNAFYGRSSESSYDCDDASYGYPRTGTPGQTWTYSCQTSSGDTTLSVDAEIVDFVAIGVAGAPVETMHVRHTTMFSGAQRGTTTADIWYAVGDARLVKNTTSVAVESDEAFGTVEYRTEYEIRLADPDPQK